MQTVTNPSDLHLRTTVAIVGGGPVGLILSQLLSQYNVNSIVVEKRVNPTPHPQAHFINARTMEIIHAHFPHLYDDIISHISNSEYWRYIYFLPVNYISNYIFQMLFLLLFIMWK
jgi:flavin-dependent dehydrogenase